MLFGRTILSIGVVSLGTLCIASSALASNPSFWLLGSHVGYGAPNYLYYPSGLTKSGDFAYSLGNTGTPGERGLTIVDVSDPTAMVTMSTIETYDPGPSKAGVYGTTILVPAQTGGVVVIDASDPSSPVILGTVVISNPQYLTVEGDYAYVLDATTQSLFILDLTVTPIPSIVGSVALGGEAFGIDVVGGYAYISEVTAGSLRVVDVSNPAAPSVTGSVASWFNFYPIAIGDYVYLVGGGSLRVFNVSNPAAPALIASVNDARTTAAGFSLDVEQLDATTIVLSLGNNMLLAADISNPAAPVLGNSVNGAGSPNYLDTPRPFTIDGNRAYVPGQNDSALTVWHVSETAPNTAPTITILGDSTATVSYGSTYSDPGATAADTEDGDITSSILVTGTVNTSIAGTYTITYDVTDSGSLSDSASRTVVVSPHEVHSTGSFLPGFGAPTLTPLPGTPGGPELHALNAGDLISAYPTGDPDVYIVNQWGFRRLFLNPRIFGFYGHLGGYSAVKTISISVRDAFPISGLFTNCNTNDGKVYALEVTGEDVGTLHHVNLTGEQALSQDPNFFKKVFCINNKEFSWYTESQTPYTSLSQVPIYSRR